MKKIISTLSVIIFLCAAQMNAQNNLTVKVSGLTDSKGTLMIALFNSPSDFLTSKAEGKTVEIKGTSAEAVFENLPDGEYAITLFQDENDNKKLDLGNYGIPVEKYGFSNNIDPAKLMGPPSFDACKFELKGNKNIEIEAVSALK